MPALKAVLQSIEGLDEASAKLYTKGDDGKYRLEVDGLVDKGKLDEFRQNNIELTNQVKKLTEDMAKFSGVDLDEYKKAMQAIESDQEKKLLKEGKFDEVFQLRTEKMRQSYEQQLKAKDEAIKKAHGDAEKATGERNSYIVDAELRRATDNPDLGFNSGVADMLKEQVLKEFVYKDGKVVRIGKDGNVVFGKQGDPATINEFLQDVAANHPYLVKASTGGGATKQPGSGTQHGQKVMKRGEFDGIQDAAKKAQLMKDGYQLVD